VENLYILGAMGVMLVLVIVALCISISNSSKLNSLINYSDDGDLVDDVEKYFKKVRELEKSISEKTDSALISRIEELEAKSLKGYSKTGMVNFDAFDDVKGSLSFALTLLNENNDGFILTSLYGHNSCNTYIRVIVNGTTATKLLDEEIESLNIAKTGV
jgi:hypothetical protein